MIHKVIGSRVCLGSVVGQKESSFVSYSFFFFFGVQQIMKVMKGFPGKQMWITKCENTRYVQGTECSFLWLRRRHLGVRAGEPRR